MCKNEIYLYADDCTLFAPIRSPSESNLVAASLNRDLERIKAWAADWMVTFEPTKCKAMMISRKRSPSTLDLYFWNSKLAVKKEIEILGVTINSKLAWAKNISTISKKAAQRLGALRNVTNKLDIKGRATVYKAQVRSVMEYACLSWMNASQTILSQQLTPFKERLSKLLVLMKPLLLRSWLLPVYITGDRLLQPQCCTKCTLAIAL